MRLNFTAVSIVFADDCSRVYLATHSGEDIRAKTNTKFISKDFTATKEVENLVFTLQLFLG